MSKQVRRLYDGFKPDHYDLSLVLKPEAMTFTGSVVITGQKTGRPSQRLTFHAKQLKVTSAQIIHHDKRGEDVITTPNRINLQPSYDEVRLHSDKMLYPGRYTIKLSFEGRITRQMNGIYPCNFKENGKSKFLLATQFESHHAREAFPCIDEPAAKATFDLVLTAPEGQTLIANTPIKNHTVKGAEQIVSFETTPKMSTYLLAFVFGELDYLEAKTKDGVVVRTYATKVNVKHTKFALEVTVKFLEFYNDYYGIPYPLAKCDLVALPDFASGAMENWGLVTFREQTLLVDPKNSSLAAKQYVAQVIAHELAHQWFGNLVTMRWWTDLWLNEGFASWMEYLAVDDAFPKWDIWTEFIVSEQEAGLKLDALENTHPVEVPIKHPDEIRTIFDTISYSKGSSVIHMLYKYLGPDNFQAGLKAYLTKHAYSNTDTVDLWSAFETVSHHPVKAFMHSWTARPGFPVVKAELSPSGLNLSQSRFYLNQASLPASELKWPIPLLPSQALGLDMLESPSAQLKLTKPSPDILLNEGKAGFYRVAYDPDHIKALAKLVKAGKLSVLDRLGILSDAFETAKAGYSSSVAALELMQAYSDENNMFVWESIVGNLGSLRAVMNDDSLRELMRPFGRKLAAREVKRLGWQPKPNESHFDTLLRPTMLSLASVSDDPAVVKEARRQFTAMKDPEELLPDLRGVIYGTVARTGDKADFDRLLSLHNKSENSEERLVLCAALTGFKQPELIKQALAQITTENVRLQDAAYWVVYSFMNHYARDLTWQWQVEHWDWLEKNLQDDLAFNRFPIYAARAYSEASFLETYLKFFDAHNGPALDRAIKQGAETIEWQSAWRKRDLAAVKQFFKI
ncbi:MAG TPA: M1 family metallopeptidase [Candidatus Binatia bacterium]|nr:M1 family metallopeptidase [Candidatus Binatia bacterium]